MAFRLSAAVADAALAPMGKVISNQPGEAVLEVAADDVKDVVGRALASLPVKDLTVENPPLEEVMSELFERSRAARAPEAA